MKKESYLGDHPACGMVASFDKTPAYGTNIPVIFERSLFSTIPNGLYEATEDAMTGNTRTLESLAETAAKRKLTKREIEHLGAGDIRVLVSQLRQQEAWISERIGYAHSKHASLKLRLSPDFAASIDYSVDVKNLQEPVFGEVPNLLWIGTYFHQQGHSTFLYCGQCKHASSWSGSKVTCRFEDGDKSEPSSSYTSSCRVVNWSTAKVQTRLDAIHVEIKAQKRRRDFVRGNIGFLKEQLPDAPKKPVAYDERRLHFRYGDRVRIYTYSNAFGRNSSTWVPATVVASATGDSKVQIVCDEPLIQSRRENGQSTPKLWSSHAWAIYQRSPFILHDWEFNYFVHRPEEAREWVGDAWRWFLYDEMTDKDYDPSRAKYLASLQDTRTHRVPAKKSRLMSAEEAWRRLGFGYEPTDAKVVLEMYRIRRDLSRDDRLLRRAKDTLLVRIYGTTPVGD